MRTKRFLSLCCAITLVSLSYGCVPASEDEGELSSCDSFEEFGGAVEEDTTLSGCYHVTSDINVGGATLTLEPGSVLKFAQTTSLNVGGDAILDAIGTADAPILLTGEEQTRGFWKGVHFDNSNSPSNVLEHVIVEYAGGAEGWLGTPAAAVALSTQWGPTRASLRHTTIRHSAGWGFWAHDGEVTIEEFSDNTITENAEAVTVLANYFGDIDSSNSLTGNDKDYVTGSGEVSKDQTWQNLDVDYLVTSANIGEGHVTIEPGTTIMMDSNASFSVSGILTAEGTEDAPITFTGKEHAAGYWRGLHFDNSNSPSNKLVWVVIEDGGVESYLGSEKANLQLTTQWGPTRVHIDNATIRRSAGHGIFRDDGVTLTGCSQMTFNEIADNDTEPSSNGCPYQP